MLVKIHNNCLNFTEKPGILYSRILLELQKIEDLLKKSILKITTPPDTVGKNNILLHLESTEITTPGNVGTDNIILHLESTEKKTPGNVGEDNIVLHLESIQDINGLSTSPSTTASRVLTSKPMNLTEYIEIRESQTDINQGSTRNRTITINVGDSNGSDVIVNIKKDKMYRSLKTKVKNLRIKKKTFMEMNFRRRCRPSHSNINC